MNKSILILFISMNCFGNLFGQKKKYEEQWDFYLKDINNQYSSIMLNLGLHSVAPLTDKPYLVIVSLKLNNPNENGLSADVELDELNKIEDALEKEISIKKSGTYAGRITSNGNRDFYYYFKSIKNFEAIINPVINKYTSYEFELDQQEDKDWNAYFELLYPSPSQFQSIQNRHVIDNLESNGDNLTKVREVFHWIYFKNEKDRELFLAKIKNDKSMSFP